MHIRSSNNTSHTENQQEINAPTYYLKQNLILTKMDVFLNMGPSHLLIFQEKISIQKLTFVQGIDYIDIEQTSIRAFNDLLQNLNF